MEQILDKKLYTEGIKDCIPTILGYISVSFACGVLLKTAGMSVLEVALLSIMLYAGSGQFIVAAMFALKTPAPAIIFTVFFVNLRHLLLSSSVAGRFSGLKTWQSFILGSELTDETFGLATSKSLTRNPLEFSWMLGANNSAHLSWITGNVLGSIFGSFVPSPAALGLDYAIVAMFVGILVNQLDSNKRFNKDIIIIAVTILSMLLFTILNFSYLSIILSSIVGATVGMVITK
ncbi:MAG: AzlC family ABC transporter permease [Clostridia bacterium]|nr:AzlC family ABC transporter permease [Clostridia bacterium]